MGKTEILMGLGRASREIGGISPRSLGRLCSKGKIDCTRSSASGKWLVSVEAVRRYLDGFRPNYPEFPDSSIERRAAVALAWIEANTG